MFDCCVDLFDTDVADDTDLFVNQAKNSTWGGKHECGLLKKALTPQVRYGLCQPPFTMLAHLPLCGFVLPEINRPTARIV